MSDFEAYRNAWRWEQRLKAARLVLAVICVMGFGLAASTALLLS